MMLSIFVIVQHQWWLSKGCLWNDTGRGKPKYSKNNLSQYHSIHKKFHMNWPRIEMGLAITA
jgi:hypothetical protein